MERHNK